VAPLASGGICCPHSVRARRLERRIENLTHSQGFWPFKTSRVVIVAAISGALIASGGARVATLHAADDLQTSRELPAGHGADTLRARCTTCHGTELIVQQRLTREGWLREVEKMTTWGAVIAPGEQEALLDYLAASFGMRSARTTGEGTTAGAALLQARCQTCHDLRLIEQQRLNAEGWARELDKMIGWGATLTDSERETLIQHLARRVR
jgi:mono/diheme cytochrome c family protein